MIACILSSESTATAERVHVEELELDAHAASSAGVGRFLRMCGVAELQIKRALEEARDTAATLGASLLRVGLEPPAATVAVTAPGSVEAHA